MSAKQTEEKVTALYKRLRACLKSSKEKCNKSESGHLKRSMQKPLAVFPKTTIFFKPSERTLNDPSLWQDLELMKFISFDNFYCCTMNMLYRVSEFISGITAVNKEILDR